MKYLWLIVSFLSASFLWSLAKEDRASEVAVVKTAAFNGPTGIGLLQMMSRNPADFDIILDPKLLLPSLIQGEYQAAVIPSNMGALLTAKGAPYKIAAVVGYGVLYLVGTGPELNDLSQLDDRTLYLSGKGATPDYLTQYLLAQSGLIPGEDILLDYSYTHPDLTKALISGLVDCALLPEPFATMALMGNDDLSIILDYQQQWIVNRGSNYPISILVISNEMAENQALVERYLSAYKDSIDWVNSHVDQAAAMAPDLGFTLKEEVLREAIGRCNLQFSPLSESRAELDSFYSALMELNPASIGGRLPGDDDYLPFH